MNNLKPYYERIPACGVFCGGCPTFTRERNPCPGAGKNFKRCEKCTTFHLCCKVKGITYCYDCDDFPCKRFKSFSKRWLKYGQDFIKNQRMLKAVGVEEFLKYYNSKVLDNVQEKLK